MKMKIHSTLLGTLLLASLMGMTANASEAEDPYLLYDEIDAQPGGNLTRMSDLYDAYLLYDEIVVTKSCTEIVAEGFDRHASYTNYEGLFASSTSQPC